MGLLLTDDTSHHKLFMLVGPPRSGKGTIARVMQLMHGKENVAGPTLSSLAMNFGLQELIGKPVAVISDARLSGRSDAAVIAERLLSISGEDCLTIDRKHRDPWTGTLPTRFLILTNELPRIADSSGALASRFVILMLTKSFLGKEDHQLMTKLDARAIRHLQLGPGRKGAPRATRLLRDAEVVARGGRGDHRAIVPDPGLHS